MLGYFLKRLLLIVPTVWLIGSLVFLLSRIIPGQYADLMAEAEQSAVGGVSLKRNRSSYLKELAESGQDKPFFYFSVRNRAQPDTLNRVFPEKHQILLQQLLNYNGNWPAVAGYYQSLQQLQTRTREKTDSTTGVLAGQVQVLLQTPDPVVISHILQELQPFKISYGGAITELQKRFDQMQQQALLLNLYLPRFKWHGSQNQYHTWLLRVITGDLGFSYRSKEPVRTVIGEALGNTLLLLIGSLFLTFAVSIQLALALSRWRFGQQPVLNALYVLDSTPLFIIAQLLFTYLAGPQFLDLFPTFGLGEEDEATTGFFALTLTRLHHLLLPALCLLITSLPYITTQLYQVLQQVLNHQYVTTARAKGLPEKQVLQQHAFRNTLLPLITLFTGSLPAIIAGALVIEYIFAIPGTGQLLVSSVLSRDYPVIIGLVLLIALIQAFAHVLADLLYFIADPRTRLKPA
ncbi:ABC transporter permease [Adhaeribacter rhizoryzae]|uniref:ABC transporter permease n=1 Tax=Adhaeribacter rhizoryzae TaxID=2607907 RepID=A0A5M6DNN4_9BACT|nr:ABC transporter permease [Adhaeribacter rhizoryzae]KAA5549094.1 ABC transporter permease [Adhaeribacter rhizoryzae]